MDLEALRKFEVFRSLSADALRLIQSRAVERTHGAGTVIWRQGAHARALLLLLAGTARATRVRAGRETVLHRAFQGDTLGEIPLFDGGGYPATLTAESPVRVLLVDRDTLLEISAREPEFCWTLLARLGHRVRDLAERLETRLADPVVTRLARYLLHRADAVAGVEFTLGMTQTHLAEDLGTVREVVGRRLRELVEAGLLDRPARARYRVRDRSGLENLARGDGV